MIFSSGQLRKLPSKNFICQGGFQKLPIAQSSILAEAAARAAQTSPSRNSTGVTNAATTDAAAAGLCIMVPRNRRDSCPR